MAKTHFQLHCTKQAQYKDPWANLAAAIIRSGEIAEDTSFLKSDWCATLRYICVLDDEATNTQRMYVRTPNARVRDIDNEW